MISPSDGKVVVIEKVKETEYFRDERIQVSIFMSPLNVHCQWSPMAGLVKYVKYHSGKYLVALPSGKNYGIVIKKDSMLFHTENIQLEKGKFKVVNKKIKLQKIKVGSRLVLKNIFYEFGTTKLLPESSAELKRLVAFLDVHFFSSKLKKLVSV